MNLRRRAATLGLTATETRHATEVRVRLEGLAVTVLTDAELLELAGLTETRHFGGRVVRWPADPRTATVHLHTD